MDMMASNSNEEGKCFFTKRAGGEVWASPPIEPAQPTYASILAARFGPGKLAIVSPLQPVWRPGVRRAERGRYPIVQLLVVSRHGAMGGNPAFVSADSTHVIKRSETMTGRARRPFTAPKASSWPMGMIRIMPKPEDYPRTERSHAWIHLRLQR